MRYANTKHSHNGIGVEPRPQERYIRITGANARGDIVVLDKAQLQALIDLLRDASILNGWGGVA